MGYVSEQASNNTANEYEHGANITNANITKFQAYKIMLKEYPDVLDIEQVSAILGVCTKTTYRLLREQKIEYRKSTF